MIMQTAIKKLFVIRIEKGELCFAPLSNQMTKSFLIAVCIIIAIALIVFPLIVSYKAQQNKNKKN